MILEPASSQVACSTTARQLADEAVARGAMQKVPELCALIDFLSNRHFRTVVEIGTARGGSLYVWAQLADPDAVLVSIDLPSGPFGGGYSEDEAQALRAFIRSEQQLECLRRDSHDEATRGQLAEILAGRGIDLLFIDGDHTYYGVRKDFFFYAPLLSSDGIVILHDIVVHSELPECRVDLLWEELRSKFEHVTFCDPHDDRGWGEWGGLGVLFGAHAATRMDFPATSDSIAALEADVERARQSLRRHEANSAAGEAERVQLRSAVGERDGRIRQLSEKVLELETFRDQLFASPTWRILRFLYGPLSRLALTTRRSAKFVRPVPERDRKNRARSALREWRVSSVSRRIEPDSIAFEPVADPRVSIVIPTYKNVDLTLRCLASIAENAPAGLYEVIAVDDASGDGSAETLRRVRGLYLVTNEENEGFLESCNRGATAAKGDYIVLLNNDTEVTNGWLEALVEVVDEDPLVGAVGSKLIYPDGRLQEAGAFIWRDGRAWNFGRGSHPDEPEFNFLRDVDYCSAASLLIRRDLWNDIGGFDRRYRPIYYEDADVCFAVADKGFRVVYEPSSVVVHHEGSTHGTEEDQEGGVVVGGKRFQYRNQNIFAEKWASRLAKHRPPGEGQGYGGGRIDDRPRVLVIDTWVPARDRDAGSLRMYWILRLLSLQTSWTSLLPWDGVLREPYTTELRRLGVEVVPRSVGVSKLAERARDFYDVVLISRPHVASEFLDEVRSTFRNATVIYDTVDLHHLRYVRKRDTVGLDSLDEERGIDVDELRLLESHCFRESDFVAAVTESEAEIIREIEPSARTIILPTVHPTPDEAPAPFSLRADLVFIGSYQHDPNIDAALYLAQQIFPLLSQRIDARLFLLGTDPPDELRALQSPRIVVPGHLSSVDPYFLHAKVFVAPLRYGAGMKGKVGHALAFGLPVVTTSIGAEGMDLVDGESVLIRNAPEEFAAATVALYEDESLWGRLSRRGQEVVRERWTPEVMGQRLSHFLSVLERKAA